MSPFLTIGSNFIDPSKIVAMSHEDGHIYINVTGGDTLDFTDAGSNFARILDEWREFLNKRESQFMEAVQYGIIRAAERGALNAN
jgi:hypothetical protein